MKDLFEKISKLKRDYDKQRDNNKFNVITALHKERDEVNLHSRIISYLLSSDSGHGMGNKYIKLFVREILKISNDKFELSNVLVLPNEKNKSEYKNIDLLIVNKAKSQAIIIENKIDAKDSNDDSKSEGYKGQLERYYNTIKLGIDKDGNTCKEYQCNQPFIYYLSLYKVPSEKSIGSLSKHPIDNWGPQNILSYGTHIREWLSLCIAATPDEKIQVKNFIQHYSHLIDKLTRNDIPMEERLNLKNIVAKNITESKYLIENFKHVKWHTVHEFWSELKNRFEEQFDDVQFFYDKNDNFSKTIEDITHRNIDINHGITFRVKDIFFYVSGLGKLSWGIESPKKWSYFFNESIENINFSNFSTDNTYNLINRNNMEKAIELIISEINAAIKDDFKTLNNY